MPYTIGIDEVGRGALAGYAAVGVVRLPIHPEEKVADILAKAGVPMLKDSKKLSSNARIAIASALMFETAHAYGFTTPEEIDQLGLTAALSVAAGRAIRIVCAERPDPDLIVVRADAGLHHPFEELLPTEWHVKGDENFPEIALASILAKVKRDEYMQEMNLKYPGYGFDKNVGYGTAQHIAAIKEKGATPIHRTSFLRNIV